MSTITVVRGNPLYFPKGNELGEHYEPLFIAKSKDGREAHGRTHAEAIKKLEAMP